MSWTADTAARSHVHDNCCARPKHRQEKHGSIVLPQLTDKLDGRVSEELCACAAQMANNLNARAIFVYTRRGFMANFLSRCRPDCPIFAFTGAISPSCPPITHMPLLHVPLHPPDSLSHIKDKSLKGTATAMVTEDC